MAPDRDPEAGGLVLAGLRDATRLPGAQGMPASGQARSSGQGGRVARSLEAVAEMVTLIAWGLVALAGLWFMYVGWRGLW